MARNPLGIRLRVRGLNNESTENREPRTENGEPRTENGEPRTKNGDAWSLSSHSLFSVDSLKTSEIAHLDAFGSVLALPTADSTLYASVESGPWNNGLIPQKANCRITLEAMVSSRSTITHPTAGHPNATRLIAKDHFAVGSFCMTPKMFPAGSFA